ncbi:MAG: translation elongation factor Ts, partial [Ruminococcus sp.]|nr:translation elongation factor Ts [Ruminococcus sp.]
MGKVSVQEIKELMTATGVGMMDCKKALVETDGDMEKAILVLREKGLATQAKKSGRVAAEGICTAVVEGNVGCVLEVNIETDFAANNQEFKDFVAATAKTVIEQNPADVEALKACKIAGGDTTVEEALQNLFIKIRENMVIRRFKRFEGILVPYVHGGGSIAVI